MKWILPQKSKYNKITTVLTYLGCIHRVRLGFHLLKEDTQDPFLHTGLFPSSIHQQDNVSEYLALPLSRWKQL